MMLRIYRSTLGIGLLFWNTKEIGGQDKSVIEQDYFLTTMCRKSDKATWGQPMAAALFSETDVLLGSTGNSDCHCPVPIDRRRLSILWAEPTDLYPQQRGSRMVRRRDPGRFAEKTMIDIRISTLFRQGSRSTSTGRLVSRQLCANPNDCYSEISINIGRTQQIRWKRLGRQTSPWLMLLCL